MLSARAASACGGRKFCASIRSSSSSRSISGITSLLPGPGQSAAAALPAASRVPDADAPSVFLAATAGSALPLAHPSHENRRAVWPRDISSAAPAQLCESQHRAHATHARRSWRTDRVAPGCPRARSFSAGYGEAPCGTGSSPARIARWKTPRRHGNLRALDTPAESLLRHLFCPAAITAKAIGQVDQRCLPAADNGAKSLNIAGPYPRHIGTVRRRLAELCVHSAAIPPPRYDNRAGAAVAFSSSKISEEKNRNRSATPLVIPTETGPLSARRFSWISPDQRLWSSSFSP